MTTVEALNNLVDRAPIDGLPELSGVLACSVRPDDGPDEPLTVSQAAELLGLTGHTLRYYERIGLVDVDRSGSGQRRYDRAALGRIVFITRLRSSGMSISDISEYIALGQQGESTVPQRLELMQRHRDKVRTQIEELRYALAVIDYKITTYGGSLAG